MGLLELGRERAGSLIIEGCRSGRGMAGALRRALKRIEKTRLKLSAREWERLPVAVEWLLDNAYLAQREGKTAEQELKRGKRLTWTGKETRLEALTAALAQAAPKAGVEELAAYLAGVQETRPLTEEELSLFVPALRGALCLRLAEYCGALEEQSEAPGLAEAMEGIFTGLRTLSTANLGPLLETSSPVEQTLLRDPAGLYGQMDEATRSRYRRQVCLLARKHNMTEVEAAHKALTLAERGDREERHIGWFLFRRPLGETEKGPSGALYVACILLPTLSLALWQGFQAESWALFFLLLLPASDLMKNLVDFCATRLVRPRGVPRMALKEGLPPEGRTLCVIAGLLTDEHSGDSYAALLERYRLANRDCGSELRFGLLADLPDREAPMGAKERRWVKRAKEAIDALNEKYDGGFYLFFRQPAFQRRDERYVGWERKRGALLELIRLLRGRPTALRIRSGDSRALAETKYVITLDSDTALNVGTARELVGAMLHPLNRPVVDKKRRVVTEGYGLLQPRVGVDLRSANRSQFSRIFAGQGGIDPYGGACSDVYHDLFDRGTYTGKGIFDVEAFAQCLDGRFPLERVLSHDLLEGAYLHAGLLEDVELTDGYPYRVTGYYSRLHRWVRGDWQLLPWLGRRVRDEAGRLEENPIASVDKWKLFDNLRRSLSPVATLLALLLGMCLSAPAFGSAAALAVVSAWSNLLLSGAELAFRGGTGLRRRYHSTIIAGYGGMLLQTLVQLLFLPYHAWICASAICTALWRSFVSHRKMLEWVTAADAERKKTGLRSDFRAQWPAVAVGAFAIVFARFPAGAAIGLVWAASPIFAWALSRPVREGKSAPAEDRPFLLHQAGLIWSYFQDWLRPEDHWLPPDNIQEKPWLGPARRTSPTNIGMALLSCVAAADLELTGRSEAVELIAHMLDTVETLEKWQGHLYNWYDTSDCTPLQPRYVSTVDSGNLRGCLIALREALYEWGEGTLARRAEALSDAMALTPLYDRERKLFTIGYDAERGEFTSGWYDLMASEARLASYLAIALGEVPPRHWRRLGRGLVGDNDYCGMASWTGTMFEYFMPNLLLPCEQGSLMYESLSFCIYAQKRRGDKTKAPWGISESGFYAFDPGMAYQYKAHGVQSLGLKRGLDRELVVAPYASFLALLLAPASAGRNLRRLRDMGLEGTYGLYEAVDLTPGRLQEGERWAVVRSFMSHHLGMSLVAIDNTLRENVMQERFLRDCSMGAFRELLQEKVPVGAPVMRPDNAWAMERPKPLRQSQFCRIGEGYDLARPACHLLSNGLLRALCTDSGAVSLIDDRGETPVSTRFRERYAPAGVSFFYRSDEGVLTALTAAPLLSEEDDFSWSFTGSDATWTVRGKDFTASVRLTLPRGERGALWSVELEGAAGGELVCYLEPVLARGADYLAHPAYSKLSLESGALDRGVLFTRRPRQGDRRASLAVLWDREGAYFDTSRERGLGRGGLSRLQQALETPAEGSLGAVVDPCLLARFPLSGKGLHHLRLALGVEDGGEKAEQTALTVLTAPIQSVGRLDGLMRSLSFSNQEGRRVMELLSALAFPVPGHGATPQSALWAYGVSGDVPIALALPPAQGDPVEPFPLKAHALLSRCGYSFDLVYLLSDGGDYHRPQKSGVLEAVKAMGLEGEVGQKGGIHLVERPPEGAPSPWEDWAAVVLDGTAHWRDRSDAPVQPPALPCRVAPGVPEWRFDEENCFVLQLNGTLPPLGWSHLLTNPRFGCLTDETGCGHLWQGNARETPITAWNNNPLAVGGPEWFLLTYGGETHSIFAGGDGLPVKVTYGFGWARWDKDWPVGMVSTTVFVPWEGAERWLRVELPQGTGELRHITMGKGEARYSFAQTLCLTTGLQGTQRNGGGGWEEALRATQERWREMTCPLWVETPNGVFNAYLNGWCLYQVIACRLFGRTSHYQNGGAYGFRDQLQDTLALLPFEPQWLREQILRCCAHQFTQGDVQHWWHEVGGEKARGVRTRISDDLLWLPYALGRYVETWDDMEFLSEQVPWLSGEPLRERERERYFVPGETKETDSVYIHALRAIEQTLARGVGEHGLLKIGTGDWNDGMDLVGAEGRGESVWLTWFAVITLEKFRPLAARQGDEKTAALCNTWAEKLRKSGELAWDGKWYLRGWYDNGAPLGSRLSEECQIDSIPQSWAAMAGGERAEEALRSAVERLFCREGELVKLFDPAFDSGEARPGYIRGYLPGVRENGGQYTHAAAWLALACLRAGWTQEGWELLQALLPANHATEKYKAEPYVLAGDVYAHPDHLGRGGWSWYTGAAGWFYQAAVNGLLGIDVKGKRITVNGAFPETWPGWRVRWRTKAGLLHIRAAWGEKDEIRLDGVAVKDIDLTKLEGEHSLEIFCKRKKSAENR